MSFCPIQIYFKYSWHINTCKVGITLQWCKWNQSKTHLFVRNRALMILNADQKSTQKYWSLISYLICLNVTVFYRKYYLHLNTLNQHLTVDEIVFFKNNSFERQWFPGWLQKHENEDKWLRLLVYFSITGRHWISLLDCYSSPLTTAWCNFKPSTWKC